MKLLPSSEYLYVDTWQKIAKEQENLVFCLPNEIRNFFKSIAKQEDEIVVLSGHSDAGIFLQKDNHPNQDIKFTMLCGIDWDHIGQVNAEYVDLEINSPCNKEQCHPLETFSAKTERHTFCTFQNIPGCVTKWFTTNLGLDHSKISWLPFGMNNDNDYEAGKIVSDYATLEKKKLLYVNFDSNNLARIRLKKAFEGCDWVTFQEKPNVPFEKYIEEMSEHKFVLCPRGNGMDCFRMYEAMYLGCVPIVDVNHLSACMLESKLPVVSASLETFHSYNIPDPFELETLYKKVAESDADYSKITRSYWLETFSHF